jgi:hypothetical protein
MFSPKEKKDNLDFVFILLKNIISIIRLRIQELESNELWKNLEYL